MLLRVATITLLIAVYIQDIEGMKRVIVVRESNINDDILMSDDEDAPAVTGSGSISQVFEMPLTLCCIFGNCSCPSLYIALTNLTSNGLINITTNVQLPSVISLVDLTITAWTQQSHCEL